jgi:DNA-binding transcriptional MerR regulator
MGKPVLSKAEIIQIKSLRETGHTLGEIKNIVKRGYGTIFRYVKNVPILPQYQDVWKVKRGGSKSRSLKGWQKAEEQVAKIFDGVFSLREKLLILAALYWGEGNKNELSLINGDPSLVKIFIVFLRELGVTTKELKISLRLFEEINVDEAVIFWLETLNLPDNTIIKINIIKGKKKGKLKYGMCRVRVEKGGEYFKKIISMIRLIRSKN